MRKTVTATESAKSQRIMMRAPRVDSPRRTALVVVGMHRSGTSALARVLSLLGAELPKDLISPSADNVDGYWESLALAHLFDEMLQAMGSSWHDIGPVEAFWQNEQFVRPYKRRLVDALATSFDDASFFVMKDPRISRLVPFIKPILDELGVETKFAIAIRNPLEVAASLKKRDGFIFAKGLLLWLDYTLMAERSTRGCLRTLILYDDLLSDWRSTVAVVASDLKMTFPAWSAANDTAVEIFLKSGSRHHTVSSEELLAAREVSDWVKTSFKALRSLARHRPGDSFSILDQVYKEFARAQTTFRSLEAEARQHEARSNELAADKATFEARIAALYASHSWRITGPFRRLGELYHRFWGSHRPPIKLGQANRCLRVNTKKRALPHKSA